MGTPYFLLNLEEYCSVCNITLPHCDFLYVDVIVNNNKKRYAVYIVEIKNANEKINLHSIRNKFYQTESFIDDILSNLGINNPDKYFVLVLPEEMMNKILERSGTSGHLKILKKEDRGWITCCGCNIKDVIMPI